MDIEKYMIFDDPVPYKSLNIYPCVMREYKDLQIYSSCLLLDKNSIPDVDIISMTYLDYLIHLNKQEAPFLMLFAKLLELVLHIPEKEEGEEYFVKFLTKSGKSVFVIDEVEYTSNDFDEIKQIIAKQNDIELIDDSIDKEIRDKMRKSDELRAKTNSFKICNLEDQCVCISIATGIPLNHIYDLTIRKFKKMLSRVDTLIHYKIYQTAVMSGMVKTKSKIQHWMRDLESDKNTNLVDFDTIKQKMAGQPT